MSGQAFQISEILEPARRFLVTLEVVQADDLYEDSVDVHGLGSSVALLEAHARNAGLNLDPERGNAHADDIMLLHEPFRPQPRTAEAKLVKSDEKPICVFRGSRNPDVKICRGTYVPVDADGITTDQQVLNSVLVERAKELFEVAR